MGCCQLKGEENTVEGRGRLPLPNETTAVDHRGPGPTQCRGMGREGDGVGLVQNMERSKETCPSACALCSFLLFFGGGPGHGKLALKRTLGIKDQSCPMLRLSHRAMW